MTTTTNTECPFNRNTGANDEIARGAWFAILSEVRTGGEVSETRLREVCGPMFPGDFDMVVDALIDAALVAPTLCQDGERFFPALRAA